MQAADPVGYPPPITGAKRWPRIGRRTGAASAMLITILIGCAGGSIALTGTPDIPFPTSPASTTTTSAPPTPLVETSAPAAAGPTAEPEPTAVAETRGPDRPGNGPGFKRPPPVTIRAGALEFDLEAWTYCLPSLCVDGAAPRHPRDVGDASSVEVEFPVDGWTFDASFTRVGPECARTQSVTLTQTGANTHLLEPAGPAGTYEVTLFGRGNGDLFVSFRWTTPHAGPMPLPAAVLAVLADHDGEMDSYGVEFGLSGLAATPLSVTAQVTVTAADGRSLTFEPVRSTGCMGEGVVRWNGPEAAGLQAADLGPAPFTYEVVLVLDGVQYSATATWPDDQIEGNEPSVSLEFSPALPALH